MRVFERVLAVVLLLEAWLMTFGPGTVTDMKWWTGWNITVVRKSLKRIGAVGVDIDGEAGYLHREDVEKVSSSQPWVALLPSLDPTTMGWKVREWYLGAYAPQLFDRNGNAGPTVWVDGRVAGGWAQRKTGEIVFEIFEDVGTEAMNAIKARGTDLETWIGGHTGDPKVSFATRQETRRLSETTQSCLRLIIS